VPDWFRADNILDGIHVYRVHDEACQTATINSLPAFLKQRAEKHTPVRLVIIDSIAFHYRVRFA
jgi:RAD51-like protein 2